MYWSGLLLLLPTLLFGLGRVEVDRTQLLSDELLQVEVSFDEPIDWQAYRELLSSAVQSEGWSLDSMRTEARSARFQLRPERAGVLALVVPEVAPSVHRVEVRVPSDELLTVEAMDPRLFGLTAEDELRLRQAHQEAPRRTADAEGRRAALRERLKQRQFPWKWLLLPLLVGAIWWLVRYVARERKLPEPAPQPAASPQERALLALDRLVAKDLPGRGLIDPYYSELTSVVRLFLEEQYGVEAPEQTTQEFLTECQQRSLFDRSTAAELEHFLRSADLIKFARADANLTDCDHALLSARALIQGVHSTPG